MRSSRVTGSGQTDDVVCEASHELIILRKLIEVRKGSSNHPCSLLIGRLLQLQRQKLLYLLYLQKKLPKPSRLNNRDSRQWPKFHQDCHNKGKKIFWRILPEWNWFAKHHQMLQEKQVSEDLEGFSTTRKPEKAIGHQNCRRSHRSGGLKATKSQMCAGRYTKDLRRHCTELTTTSLKNLCITRWSQEVKHQVNIKVPISN